MNNEQQNQSGETEKNQPQGLVPSRDASPELDALVAEKVMGLYYYQRFVGDVAGYWCPRDHMLRVIGAFACRQCVISEAMPAYSTEIAAAWTVVEKMEERGWNATLRRLWDGFAAEFDNMARTHVAHVDPRNGGMPLAICRAALAAMEAS